MTETSITCKVAPGKRIKKGDCVGLLHDETVEPLRPGQGVYLFGVALEDSTQVLNCHGETEHKVSVLIQGHRGFYYNQTPLPSITE